MQKGPLYRKEWTNVYFSLLPQPPDEHFIHYHDIRKPLPFADETFDTVYAMHVIEHLTPSEGEVFVNELRRILNAGAICRLSTPDLEDIIENYFDCFHRAYEKPCDENLCNHRWAQMELFDQLVRVKSGGQMMEAIVAGYYKEEYLKERYGDVYVEFNPQRAGEIQQQIAAQREEERSLERDGSILAKIKRNLERNAYRRQLAAVEKAQGGDVRKSLEVNRWVYDRLSLRLLMESCGFRDYQVKTYKTSDIDNWERYQLDRSNFGDYAIEPSLYVEAKRP